MEKGLQQNEINNNENQLNNAQSIETTNNVESNNIGGLNANDKTQESFENNQIETENLISKIEEIVQGEFMNDSSVLTRLEANDLIFLIQRWNELQNEEEISQELFSINER